MNKSASKIKMNSRFDEMFASAAPAKGNKRQIDLTELYPFKNHPFHVVDDDRMMQLVDSIKDRGILVPGLARPREDGGYELISGHRRKRAAELAGLVEMPVEIRDMTDDEAVIAMVDANLQREETLPSEKAFAYKMKLEALSHQGKRIIFTIKEIRKWLRCGKDKAMKTMRELDTDSGIGLVDRMSREAGKSDIIFVNDFNEYVETGESDGADRTIPVVNPIMEDAVFGDEYGDEYSGQTVGKNEAVGFSDRSCEGHPNDMPLNNGFTDHDNFSQVGKSDHPVGKSDPPVGNHDPRYTDSKNTETEYTESDHILSAHSSGVIHILPPRPKDRNDEMIENRRIYEEIIKEQIGYDYIFTENSYKFEKDTIDGIIDIMVDIVTFERKTVRVNSIDMPYQVVKSKFLKIDAESFRYALDKLKESGIGRSVGNEKNYIITVLYNASDTIDFHFRAMVNHDMYGDGLAERGIKIQ